MFGGNLLCFSLWPLPLILALGTTGKSLAPFSLHSFFVYFYTLRSLLSLLFSGLKIVQALSAFPRRSKVPSSCSWHFSGLFLARLCLFYWGHSTPGVASPGSEEKERITSLHLLAIFSLMQPRIPLAFFVIKAHY